jgi:dCMP deaminase
VTYLGEKWDRRFLRLCSEIASWSKDPTTKVGCVVVTTERHILSTGYNGFPKRAIDDDDERLGNRKVKRMLTAHAEANAIACRSSSIAGCTLYCSHPPCVECCKLIVQSGITRVVFSGELHPDWKESVEVGLALLLECGIQWKHLHSGTTYHEDSKAKVHLGEEVAVPAREGDERTRMSRDPD